MIQIARPSIVLIRLYRCPCTRALPRMVHAVAVQDTIIPNEREAEIFKILTSTLSHGSLSSVLRCAGGWVRDKLLGLESDDIDIAVDNMLGREFADHVNSFLQSQKLDTRKVAVITSNPEQSKHLETARMRLAGLELDLVNLRSETYTDSRIPEMTFGTPLQDAERRDFTINSLFYNLNSEQVEDFTGSGLDDLKKKIIRTPLPASQTFLDDPLRVLRALRFAARFGFSLDLSLREAAASDKVREALAKKVSRERMGVELDKMFTGKGPVTAMRDMERLQLLPAVFAVPQATERRLGTSYGADCVSLLEAADQLIQDWQPAGRPFSKDERRVSLMAAFLLPLRALQLPLKGSRSQPLTSHILLNSIKWRNSDASCVEASHMEAPALFKAYQRLQGLEPLDASEDIRISVGLALRALKADKWRIGILLAPLVAMSQAAPAGIDPADSAEALLVARSPPSGSHMNSREARSECCKQLEAAIVALRLQNCWEWKPLLDGKEIIRITGAKGPAIGKQTAELMKYQLAHPDASAADAKSFLQQRRSL